MAEMMTRRSWFWSNNERENECSKLYDHRVLQERAKLHGQLCSLSEGTQVVRREKISHQATFSVRDLWTRRRQ